MAYATLDDVAAKWRPLTSAADQARVTALLEEAVALLDSELPKLVSDVASGAVNPVLARMVVTNAVIRVLSNPAGVVSQTLGPESVAFAGVRTLGSVAFTDDELAMLTPADPNVPAGVDGMAVGSASLKLPRGLARELHPHHRFGFPHGGGRC